MVIFGQLELLYLAMDDQDIGEITEWKVDHRI